MDLSLPVTIALIFLFTSLVVGRVQKTQERFVAAEGTDALTELGGLLLKRQDYAAAGRWLRAAYNGREALPDGGRRVRMQLRELARRLAQRGHPPADDPSSG